MRRFLICATLLLAGPAQAHDFWIQPQAFHVAAGGEAPLTLQVGDGPDRSRSAIPLRRVTRFEVVQPDGAVRDAKTDLTLGGPEADGTVRLAGGGVHVLVLATDAGGKSRLPAVKFNAYLADEGLAPAIEARAKAGRTGHDGDERYGRAAKALVLVGEGDGSAALRPVGLPLEITPLANPYARPGSLPVRVTYHGKALAGALVKLTDMARDTETFAQARTDAAGEAVFPMPAKGEWRLAVVWTRPLGPDDDADFETTFSSLTFGLDAPGGAGGLNAP